jgi:hypothetical protein
MGKLGDLLHRLRFSSEESPEKIAAEEIAAVERGFRLLWYRVQPINP